LDTSQTSMKFKTQLQSEFFEEFSKLFPSLTDKVEIEAGVIQNDCIAITIPPDNPEFGEITFDINDEEITLFTKFDHSHHETYIYGDSISEEIKRKNAISSALTAFKEIIEGNVVITVEKKGDKIVRSHRHYTEGRRPGKTASEPLFPSEEDSTERLTVTWNGILKKEKLLLPTKATKNRADSALSELSSFLQGLFRAK
jgi:hypothetical protein